MKRFLVWGGILAAVAGVAYLATLGCCQLMASRASGVPLAQRLGLTAEQRGEVAQLDREYLAQKQASCQMLCAKRAQVIELLKQPDPDRAALAQLVQEIGQEQTLLERATLDHLLAVNRKLELRQRAKLMGLVSEDLRTACKATACGMTPGCAVGKQTAKR